MKTNFFYTLFITTIIITSCQKEEFTEKSINNRSSYNSSSRLADGTDFDTFGLLHNQILDEVAIRGNIVNLSRKDRFNLAVGIIIEAGIEEDSLPTWPTMNKTLGFVSSLKPKNAANKLIDVTSLTELERGIITDLYEFFEVVKNSDTLISIAYFSNQINIIESNIYNTLTVEYDVATNEVNNAGHLLVVCSIARYSYSYWINVALDENHPWHVRLDNGNSANLRCGFFCKIKAAIKYVLDDIGAGLSGSRNVPIVGALHPANAESTAYNAALGSVSG